jgi:hypothetical protein
MVKVQILNCLEAVSHSENVIQGSFSILWLENFWGAKAVCVVVETPAEAREGLPNAAHVVFLLAIRDSL